MPSAAPPSPPPGETLGTITHLLDHLLPAALSVPSFTSRWQAIRRKLAAVKSLLAEISDSPHWSENPLLPTLLPAILSTLRRTETLCHHCSDASFSGGKLLMQSDLDMAAGWLSRQINDLELLLRSGVLHQSTAIVLSRPDAANSSKDELAFFVRDLFTRLQIGGLEFKKKALDSLIQLLSDDDKSAAVVAKEGNISCLVSFLDPNAHYSIRELAVVAVSLLVSAGDSPRKCVFEEGALGPLLRIIECGTMPMKESAAMAVEFITDDPDNAWAISAYGGVPILIELCKSGSIAAQSHAAGAMRNVSSVEEIRIALAEEGAIPVLMQLLVSGIPSTQGKAANCISILASTNEHFRGLLLQDRGLQRLLQLFCDCSNSDTMEHVLRAIYSLSVSDTGYRMLSGSTAFILQIADLVKHGNVMLQHISASLLANLAISDGNKRAVVGCMGSLVKLMESVKPDGMQEVGAKALLSLLTVKSNKKEFVRDEKSLMRLMQMLDPKNEVVCKKFPVAVVAAIMAGGSQGCRKKLVAAGAYVHVQRLAELEVAGAKKALQRLSANRLTSILTRAWRE
ncbi:ARM repeat superfamily protein [Perilla frutescens var. hirtella]|uniref:ARM repeat superfamily protein n=1 Tax=Perilla frutescens var. hirtella TaxID=608512 RepID=A0AAD4JIQ9_PERFH|nr:ARM repeat superfamily protein [Perilla frutescens var. hirtella]